MAALSHIDTFIVDGPASPSRALKQRTPWPAQKARPSAEARGPAFSPLSRDQAEKPMLQDCGGATYRQER